MSQMVKNLPAVQETWVWSLDWKILWKREWLPAPVFLLENSMDRGTWQPPVPGVEESDTTEHVGTHGFFIFCCSRRRPGISISGKVPRSQVPAYLKGVGEWLQKGCTRGCSGDVWRGGQQRGTGTGERNQWCGVELLQHSLLCGQLSILRQSLTC